MTRLMDDLFILTGIKNIFDICPNIWNPGQYDYDGDRIGDECDNCVFTPNVGQVCTYVCMYIYRISRITYVYVIVIAQRQGLYK